jgi:iron complex transport system substrate-binding protein
MSHTSEMNIHGICTATRCGLYLHEDLRHRNPVCFHPSGSSVSAKKRRKRSILLGEDHRIVGISGYADRPPQARREKPCVSAFISADIPKILALEPDLVLMFSDLQAEIVALLVQAGVPVHAFNQRTVAAILDMIRTLGALVATAQRADELAVGLAANLERTRQRSAERAEHPKVHFEERDEPMISGIGWISELIAIAGGVDIFPELAGCKSAKDRITTPEAVIAGAPDIIIGSWCGKKFSKDRVAARPGFDAIPAVRALERVMRTMAQKYPRPHHKFVDDFILPWKRHFPGEV